MRRTEVLIRLLQEYIPPRTVVFQEFANVGVHSELKFVRMRRYKNSELKFVCMRRYKNFLRMRRCRLVRDTNTHNHGCVAHDESSRG